MSELGVVVRNGIARVAFGEVLVAEVVRRFIGGETVTEIADTCGLQVQQVLDSVRFALLHSSWRRK